MWARYGDCRIELVQGDITLQDTDAIVNAANARLAGGGGVDGAVHVAWGPGLLQETEKRYPNGCATGEAVVTGPGRLKARILIHAVGPVWRGGQKDESRDLAAAYRRSLELAVENDCRSIAFPAISTGAYGYPTDLAARISLDQSRDFLVEHGLPERIRFVLFDAGDFGAYARILESMT
ncbi:MAG: macro domain-containing protein [Planctomycetaceae bacterium]